MRGRHGWASVDPARVPALLVAIYSQFISSYSLKIASSANSKLDFVIFGFTSSLDFIHLNLGRPFLEFSSEIGV